MEDNNYKRFLKDYSPERLSKIGQGDIIDETGEVVGKHSGYTNYTVGQRKGLGLSNPKPSYVSKIDPVTNQITASKKESLEQHSCTVSKMNWLVDNFTFPSRVHAQIRYNSPIVPADIIKNNSSYKITFQNPQAAITPGQSIVFYQNDVVLGGGIIERNIPHR